MEPRSQQRCADLKLALLTLEAEMLEANRKYHAEGITTDRATRSEWQARHAVLKLDYYLAKQALAADKAAAQALKRHNALHYLTLKVREQGFDNWVTDAHTQALDTLPPGQLASYQSR